MIRLSVLVVAAALTQAAATAPEPPVLVWEATGFVAPESAVFDAARQLFYVSNMGTWGEGATPGDGFVSRLSAEGRILDLRWITGLQNPKGLALANGRLYAADDAELIEIDPATGTIVARYAPPDGPGGFKGYVVNGKARRFMGYSARGVSSERVVDDGTIVPTAAGGSVPFAPEITIPALMTMKAKYGDALYTRYGFKDSFNPSFTFVQAGSRSGSVDPQIGWIARDYIGIDQGPILVMMENHRSGLVWRVMRRNPHIREGLKRIGFTGGWLDEAK